MERASGCFWAIEIGERHYPVSPKDLVVGHENHGPEGMCNMSRQARVDGEVKGGRFLASRFELLPATDVPIVPTFTPADKH
jgi:hypothetical protein